MAKVFIRNSVCTQLDSGFILLELIIATSILLVLSTMAVPLARLTIQRQNERQLRIDVWEMRDAIDRNKMAADRDGFQTKADSQNYPPDLETLVKGSGPHPPQKALNLGA
jgi:general secretion pathway protein G